MHIRLAILYFLVCIIVPHVTDAQSCPYMLPPDSPVLSTSPDDIPPANGARLLTWQGTMFYARPNHQLAFVQTGPNEQRVWFAIAVDFVSDPENPNDPPPNSPLTIYYNRRYRANESSPWYWQWSQSVALNISPPVNAQSGFGPVLYSPTPKYSAGPGGTLYRYVMYGLFQPAACNGPVGGYGMVTFSNDGTCWTNTYLLHRSGGPCDQCGVNLGCELVPVEAIGAVDGGDQIYLLGMEGDNSILVQQANMDHNYASWGVASPTNAALITITPNRDVSDAGLFKPLAFNDNEFFIPNRYRSYAYFFNLAMAWDATAGDLYVTRGYPYPYDRCNTCGPYIRIPTNCQEVTEACPAYPRELLNWNYGIWQSVANCGGTAGLYPNRYQIYKMHLGTLSNFDLVHSGTWTLVADRGNNVGYETQLTGLSTPLVAGQTSGDRDAGSAAFLVNGSGHIVRTNGLGYVFAGSTIREHLSVGPCLTTGNERVVLNTVP